MQNKSKWIFITENIFILEEIGKKVCHISKANKINICKPRNMNILNTKLSS